MVKEVEKKKIDSEKIPKSVLKVQVKDIKNKARR